MKKKRSVNENYPGINIASCGLGVNSIAGIIEATNRGVIFDHILFANTGIYYSKGEKQATYAYLEVFNQWLLKNGQPYITLLHSKNVNGEIISLYDEVYKLDTLPSIVFGWKSCSQRFKGAVQDKHVSTLPEVQEDRLNGNTLRKWIFYDADESHRAKEYSDDKFEVYYFLVDIDFGRFECLKVIADQGLPIPQKSSCKYCPSTKPYQIIELYETERLGFYESAELERNALRGGKLLNVLGLGRDWSWWELILAYRYFRFFKKNASSISKVHPKIKKMIKRINRSKPEKLSPRNQNPSDLICNLFTSANDIPCGCYDG